MKELNSWKPTFAVTYKVFDNENKIKESKSETSCFSSITYNSVFTKEDRIQIYISKTNTKYQDKEVERWIDLINKLGFPCKLTIKNEKYLVDISGKDINDKLTLNSTLMLIRYLYESFIDQMPEIVFYILDNHPRISEWDALQLAHINPQKGYGNSNHTIRSFGVQTIITKEEYLKNAKKCKSLEKAINTNGNWMGKWMGEKTIKEVKILISKNKWDEVLKLLNA